MRNRFAAFVLVGLLVLLVGLAGQLIYINTALHPRLASIAVAQQRSSKVLPARRGTILDARGRVVAAGRLLADVFVDPRRVTNIQDLASALGTRLDLEPQSIIDRIQSRSNQRFVEIASGVDEAEAEAVKDLKSVAVGLLPREIRTYPLGSSMAHVIGFVGRDGTGLEGVEKEYDHHLRGKDGRRSTLVDARRRTLRNTDLGSTLPEDGGHLVLTLDAEIQRMAEEVLAASLREFEAKSGVAILMDPRNGDILALVCLPAFDPNEGSKTAVAARRNRALTDPVEPGSAFKPFIASGALEGGYISATEQIDCHQGEHRFGSRRVADTSPHGLMDIAGIMTHSSNIGMAIIGQRMGNRALYQTVRNFGFGDRTGIDCPGEGFGKLRPLHRWSSSTVFSAVSVSMGYEISVTPIQLITAFCGLIQDGVMPRPRLAKQLLNSDGGVVRSWEEREESRRVARADIARFVGRQLLTSAVEHGTGRRAQLDRYQVLGKTGTPKLLDSSRRHYEAGAYQPTFVGAAPASDPRVAVLVMIHRPNASRGYYGGIVAAPAGAKMLDWTLDYFGVPPDRTTMLSGL